MRILRAHWVGRKVYKILKVAKGPKLLKPLSRQFGLANPNSSAFHRKGAQMGKDYERLTVWASRLIAVRKV